ncbi:MAG: Ribose import binding protein RbsB [Verrucomicrobia subdivision 3 bacterium]|nr:Ribose import binding protein RbsB [Limisphaerales bacterium]MCS1415892.1 Ribose import binding protein RbsB [Limisphaerales bacterium]
MKSRSVFLFVLSLVGVLLLIGCGQPDSGNPKIAFVSNSFASFWTIAQRGVEKAGADLGVDAEVYMPVGGITDQKRILEDLVTQGVDGIAVSPIAPDDQMEFLNQIAEHTKLITQDSDAPGSNRMVYIGMDNYKAGRMCGELVKEALPDGGSIMIFVGRIEQDNARRRRQGVIDELLGREYDPENFDPPGKVLSGGGFEILGTMTDQFDRAKGKANVEDTLSRYPDIKGMVGLFVYNPPLALEALEQAGKLGQVKVIAFDEAESTLQGIIDGTVHGTVVQDPYMYGYKSVEVLKQIIDGDLSSIPENKFIDIPARYILRDNVEAFWADLKEKIVDDAE